MLVDFHTVHVRPVTQHDRARGRTTADKSPRPRLYGRPTGTRGSVLWPGGRPVRKNVLSPDEQPYVGSAGEKTSAEADSRDGHGGLRSGVSFVRRATVMSWGEPSRAVNVRPNAAERRTKTRHAARGVSPTNNNGFGFGRVTRCPAAFSRPIVRAVQTRERRVQLLLSRNVDRAASELDRSQSHVDGDRLTRWSSSGEAKTCLGFFRNRGVKQSRMIETIYYQ